MPNLALSRVDKEPGCRLISWTRVMDENGNLTAFQSEWILLNDR